MAYYRIYVLNGDKHVINRTFADCETDREACVLAESLLEPGVQVEVWNGTRHVRVASLPSLPGTPRPLQ